MRIYLYKLNVYDNHDGFINIRSCKLIRYCSKITNARKYSLQKEKQIFQYIPNTNPIWLVLSLSISQISVGIDLTCAETSPTRLDSSDCHSQLEMILHEAGRMLFELNSFTKMFENILQTTDFFIWINYILIEPTGDLRRCSTS